MEVIIFLCRNIGLCPPLFSDVTLLKLKILIEDYNNKQNLKKNTMRTSFVVMAAVAALMSHSNAIQLAGTEVSVEKVEGHEKRIARIERKLDIDSDQGDDDDSFEYTDNYSGSDDSSGDSDDDSASTDLDEENSDVRRDSNGDPVRRRRNTNERIKQKESQSIVAALKKDEAKSGVASTTTPKQKLIGKTVSKKKTAKKMKDNDLGHDKADKKGIPNMVRDLTPANATPKNKMTMTAAPKKTATATTKK